MRISMDAQFLWGTPNQPKILDMFDKTRAGLVFTDSRGKSLDAFIENEAILVKAFSGAKLINIVNYAARYIWDLKPARVLFKGGTCDLTVKSHTT